MKNFFGWYVCLMIGLLLLICYCSFRIRNLCWVIDDLSFFGDLYYCRILSWEDWSRTKLQKPLYWKMWEENWGTEPYHSTPGVSFVQLKGLQLHLFFHWSLKLLILLIQYLCWFIHFFLKIKYFLFIICMLSLLLY